MRNLSSQEVIRSHLIVLPGAWGIYLNELFRRISTSMVGLFIPLYIYKETGDLLSIPIYYLIFSVTAFCTELPSAYLIKKIGIDKGLALGSLFRTTFLYTLIFANHHHMLFWVSAFAFGLTMPFDWLPHYYSLAKMAKKGHQFGNVASFSKIFTRLGSSLGPVVGGLCIQLWGFSTLYFIAGTLIIVAGIMPFLDKFEKIDMHVSGKEIINRLFDPGIIKHIFAFGTENYDGIVSIMIWPIFLFTTVGSYGKSGAVETLALLVGIISLYMINKLVKNKKYNAMRWGSIAIILGWVGRLFMKNINGIWLANLSYLSGTAFLFTPVWSLLYSCSVAKKYTMEFWLVHELLSHGLLALICLAIWYALSHNFGLSNIIYTDILIIGMSLIFPWLYRGYIQRYG